MELSCSKLKKPLYFQENYLGFSITVSSGVFILPLIFTIVCWVFSFNQFIVFHHCLCRCFHFTNVFYYCFSVIFISPTFLTMTVFFVRYFVFVLLYRECYRFKRASFTLKRFLPYMPSRHLAQPVFLKASIEAGSSSLKVAGPPTAI